MTNFKRRIITGGLGLALFLLSAVGIVSYVSIQRLSKNQEWLNHTHQVLDAIARTVAEINDAERERRGFVLTQDPNYRDAYEISLQTLDSTLQTLKQLIADDPQQQQQVKKLESLIRKRRAILQQSIEQLAQDPTDQTTQITLTHQGKPLQQDIQTILTQMEQKERILLAQRLAATQKSTQYILLIAAVGYVLSFSLILGVYKLLIQQIRRRQQIEETLRQTNDQLEQRVQERTTQLTQSNHSLQAEIEERIRVETILKERDEQLNLAMEAAKMGSWDWNMITNQVIWSKSHEQLFGLIPGTFDGTYSTFESCVYPDDRDSITQAINDALAHHQDYHHEFRVVWSDGTVHWIEGKGKFFYNHEGKPVRMLGTVIDITDRKQVELALQQANDELEMRVTARTTALCLANERLQQELFERQQAEIALRDSEEKFRQLAENIQDVFWISNPEKTHLIYVSPAYELIWGRRCERLYGSFRDWIDAIHPEDRKQVETILFDTIIQSQYQQEYRIVRPDGSVRWIRDRGFPIKNESGEVVRVAGIAEDISDSRVIEQMKNEFISVVSHELRTPLTSIRGSLGLLASGVLKNKPETANKMLEIADQDTERLVRLVNDILDLDRLETYKVTFVKQWCDAETLIQKAVEPLQALAEENQITLGIIPTSLQIWAEPDRIIQTLVNLLSNGIKFSPPKSTVTIRVQNLGDRVLFEVKDQGRGIPTDKLETIFGRFQQVDASDSRSKGGTGLGLTICRSIVQQHGGKIWVESGVGEGSRFYFTLPFPLS